MKNETKTALSFSPLRQNGSVKSESCIAYAFTLPHSDKADFQETEEFIKSLSENYLSFLKKESEKPCDFVRFGGLRFEQEENTLTLLAAFCPFSEREYRAVAKLILDETGTLLSIKKEKRSRRKTS